MDKATNSDDPTFTFPTRKERVVSPITGSQHQEESNNPAVALLRQKIDKLYNNEPNAKSELREAEAIKTHRSKHQQFMHELSGSGKSLADIQTEWHNYYVGLPDDQKHAVWQEFYSNYSKLTPKPKPNSVHSSVETNPLIPEIQSKTIIHIADPIKPSKKSTRTVTEIKQQLLGQVSKRVQIQQKHANHLRSLAFGLSMGFVVLAILMFGFFNERFIAPFITPSKSVSATPIIIDPSSSAVGPESKIIIPKINVEIPVVYDEPSIEESAVQNSLEKGVLHYATTPNPGEIGNSVIFGHSSNNILNRGKYKFAFVLLKQLENNDTFIVQKDGKRFVYKVYEKKVVSPADVSVLGTASRPSTITLITCDPPGTSINRLIVIGEQISPDPVSNVASKVSGAVEAPQKLPSDAPSLWQRMTGGFRD